MEAVCVCVPRGLTIVSSCVFTLVGGGQCRKQRLHVHDEVFMAQRVKTAALTKLDSENTTFDVNTKLLCCFRVYAGT